MAGHGGDAEERAMVDHSPPHLLGHTGANRSLSLCTWHGDKEGPMKIRKATSDRAAGVEQAPARPGRTALTLEGGHPAPAGCSWRLL